MYKRRNISLPVIAYPHNVLSPEKEFFVMLTLPHLSRYVHPTPFPLLANNPIYKIYFSTLNIGQLLFIVYSKSAAKTDDGRICIELTAIKEPYFAGPHTSTTHSPGNASHHLSFVP
jgi:hypothetical protein